MNGDYQRVFAGGKSAALRALQVLLDDLVSSMAKLKILAVDDVGTELATREDLFKRIIPPQVKVQVGGSVEVLSTFPDHYLDWGYVDSGRRT